MILIKIILINFILFFALLGMVLIVPPIAINFYRMSQPLFISLVDIPQYENSKWINEYLQEYSKLERSYQDYIGWKYKDFQGEYLNIKDGLRRTTLSSVKNARQVFFFGGSAIWGYGVADGATIPSIFTKTTGYGAKNYGENGFSARQSLALLQNIYLTEKKTSSNSKLVLFYDGVNDVVDRCKTSSSVLGSNQEYRTKKLTEIEIFSFSQTFLQLRIFLSNLSRKIQKQYSSETIYECDFNSSRAQEVAMTLVKSWESASMLASNNGDKFLAVLQPVAHLGNPKIDYLPHVIRDTNLRLQYEAVYPLIRQYASRADIEFIDLTDVFDTCEFCYIDFCHVSKKGNKFVTHRIIEEITRRGL